MCFTGIKWAYVKVKSDDFRTIQTHKIPKLYKGKAPFNKYEKYWVVDGEDKYIAIVLIIAGNNLSLYDFFMHSHLNYYAIDF